MKIPSLLPLALLSAFACAAPTATTPRIPGNGVDLPIPYPEAGLFAPSTARPVPKGHPAWETIVSLDAKGLPLRAVLAAMFESAKLQYAVDPGLDLTIYVNVKEVSLRDAVTVLGRLADFDVRAEGSVWYASRRKPKVAAKAPNDTVGETTLSGPIAGAPKSSVTVRTTVVATNAAKPVVATKRAAKGTLTTVARPVVTTMATQAIEVDTTPRRVAVVPMRVTPPTKIVRTSFPAGTTNSDLPVVSTSKPVSARSALGRRVTTKMSRTDLRTVFESFSQQTGVPIVVDESVPRYKIDSFMKGTSLKYALDRLCAAAGLRHETQGAAIRIVKAR